MIGRGRDAAPSGDGALKQLHDPAIDPANVARLFVRLVDERPEVLRALHTLLTALLENKHAPEVQRNAVVPLEVEQQSASPQTESALGVVDLIDFVPVAQSLATVAPPVERAHAQTPAEELANEEALQGLIAKNEGRSGRGGLSGGLGQVAPSKELKPPRYTKFGVHAATASSIARYAGTQSRRLQAIRAARHAGATVLPDVAPLLSQCKVEDWTVHAKRIVQLAPRELQQAQRWYALLAGSARELADWFVLESTERIHLKSPERFKAELTARVECIAIAQHGILDWIETDARVAKSSSDRFCGVQGFAFASIKGWTSRECFGIFLKRGMSRVRLISGEERDEIERRLAGFEQARLTLETAPDPVEAEAAEAAPTSRDRRFLTVLDAFEAAREKFSTWISFSDAAAESASESCFRRPDDVFECFRAIDEVATKRAHGARDGVPLSDDFLQAKVRMKFCTPETMQRFRNIYYPTYNGVKVDLSQHVTLGARNANTCLSIHWWRDPNTDRFIILHCGRHLPNSLS